MAPRWKKKDAEAKAKADPMSKIVSQLQSSLIQGDARGSISGSVVQLEADQELTDLLNRTCFGSSKVTAESDKQRFQLSLEEAFYLCYSLNCLKIDGPDKRTKNHEELWHYMKSRKAIFPESYKAYSHLRMKNWVVRPGSPQYGVDFVAYCHHPVNVHSEYAVIFMSEGGGDNPNGRLRVWSDVHCTVRLCGSVVKTLLVLNISRNGHDASSPLCLEHYTVEARTITRWIPEQCRDDQKVPENGTKSTTPLKSEQLPDGIQNNSAASESS